MYKYLKKMFANAVSQGQQLVGRNVQTLDSIVTENEGNILDCVEPCRLPRRTDMKKSLAKMDCCTRHSDKEIKKMRREFRSSAAQQLCKELNEGYSKPSLENKEKAIEKNSRLLKDTCSCENCSIVSSLNECGVCLESLQYRGIRSCPVCANIVCSNCVLNLTSCPFCRSSKPMQKNRAIERLLRELLMPCKNARNGCRKILNADMRLKHEATCEHTSMNCPISNGCCWSGPSTSMLSHLHKAHGVKPLQDDGLTVEISNFREKSTTREGEYTMYLSCYDQLFAVKVMLYRSKLMLSFLQLGFLTAMTERNDEKRYGVWLRIRAAGKAVRGILPFGKFVRETRQIAMNCKTLCPEKDIPLDYDDRVKIEISIREMEEELINLEALSKEKIMERPPAFLTTEKYSMLKKKKTIGQAKPIMYILFAASIFL